MTGLHGGAVELESLEVVFLASVALLCGICCCNIIHKPTSDCAPVHVPGRRLHGCQRGCQRNANWNALVAALSEDIPPIYDRVPLTVARTQSMHSMPALAIDLDRSLASGKHNANWNALVAALFRSLWHARNQRTQCPRWPLTLTGPSRWRDALELALATRWQRLAQSSCARAWRARGHCCARLARADSRLRKPSVFGYRVGLSTRFVA